MQQDSASDRRIVPDVQFIPWDPDSEEHVQRLIQQRIACRWDSDMVESRWKEMQRLGHKSIHWIVSPLLSRRIP